MYNPPYNIVYKNKLYKLHCWKHKYEDFDTYFRKFLKDKDLTNGEYQFKIDDSFTLKVEVLNYEKKLK